MMSSGLPQRETMFGHPVGLFTVFFAEMWERFSYYGMRALLVFYMLKGFLGYGDHDAYAVYGAYTALVYMAPFLGGMLADRLLGARRAVVVGGLLMCAGQALLMWQNLYGFYLGLALLICGNGCFKPNISTIVGTLYERGSPKRDSGFTIFYMGVNLGAALSPLVCGYIGETYGWHYGFGVASVGMLIGVIVFVASPVVAQAVILLAAVGAAATLFSFQPEDIFSRALSIFMALALLAAAAISCCALRRGGLPRAAGAPPDLERLRRPVWGALTAEHLVYAGIVLAVPVFFLLVSGGAPLMPNQRGVTLVPRDIVQRFESSRSPVAQVLAVVIQETSRPAGLALAAAGLLALLYLCVQTLQLERIPRHRMYVVFILTFFSMLFWSFFEQAGSSINNFTDRNVDRVLVRRVVTASEVGSVIRFRIPPDATDRALQQLPLLSQAQLGQVNADPRFRERLARTIRAEEARKGQASAEAVEQLVRAVTAEPRLTLTGLTYLRRAASRAGAPTAEKIVLWPVTAANRRMKVAASEVPASLFQAVNPIYILLFGLALTILWSVLARAGLEPSTPVKFALGLIQLGLGFAALAWGAQAADDRGMAALAWLLIGYLLHTTGELCLSPVGLSMITRLTPAQLVSTVMGTWFLATAFSQFLAAIIAQFAGVKTGGETGLTALPVPLETAPVYRAVFAKIAVSAMASGLACLGLAPLLKHWMHSEE